MPLREFQEVALNRAVDFISKSEPGERLLLSAPTGSGKSYIETALREWCAASNRCCAIVSSRVEILYGIAAKIGIPCSKVSELESLHLWTPIRLRNRMQKNEALLYDVMILDEAHHSVADSWETIVLMNAMAKVVGFTATPFRGSPKETEKLKKFWTHIEVALTWTDAVEQKIIAMPDVRMAPLLDDDVIHIQGDDFKVNGKDGLNDMMQGRMQALVEVTEKFWNETKQAPIVALPSTELVDLFLRTAEGRFFAFGITQATPSNERQRIFQAFIENKACIVQIDVVSEGVDLPARLLIDAKPTMSPVKWLQQTGRITRPTETQPTYVCTNRNLERHGYLFEGLLPCHKVKEITEAFGEKSVRTGGRYLGFEKLSRFTRVSVPLANGLDALAVNLYKWEDNARYEYFIIMLPLSVKYIAAKRRHVSNMDGTMTWGYWKRCEMPEGFEGFQTSKAKQKLSEKQAAWWKRDAAKFGLDDFAVERIDSRTFQALPFLKDLRIRIGRKG